MYSQTYFFCVTYAVYKAQSQRLVFNCILVALFLIIFNIKQLLSFVYFSFILIKVASLNSLTFQQMINAFYSSIK